MKKFPSLAKVAFVRSLSSGGYAHTSALLKTGDGMLRVIELKNEPNNGDEDGAQLVITDAKAVYENTTIEVDNSLVPTTGISVGQVMFRLFSPYKVKLNYVVRNRAQL